MLKNKLKNNDLEKTILENFMKRGNIDASRKDIWRYAKMMGKLGKSFQINPRQNFTPVEKMGKYWLKREDKSVVGSHKFRGIVYQLSKLRESDEKLATLSSSGNAAIATSFYAKESGVKTLCFLSKKTPKEKLSALKFSENFISILSSKPLRLAKYASKHFKIKDLKPSVDENARIGFRSLGFEIFEEKNDVENIFSFATSFASMLGMLDAYENLKDLNLVKKIPRLYAVYSKGNLAGSLSRHLACLPDRQVDKNRQMLDKKITLVEVNDEEILSTREKFLKLQTSMEGFASLAAQQKVKPKGETLVVLTGKDWKSGQVEMSKFEEAENFEDVDRIVASF